MVTQTIEETKNKRQRNDLEELTTSFQHAQLDRLYEFICGIMKDVKMEEVQPNGKTRRRKSFEVENAVTDLSQ